MRGLGKRVRQVVTERILNVDDTPHRIALGVFLGSVIAWTPTLGFQLALYVVVATLFRANKVSGIPLVFVTNPLTAVPCYWLAWQVGAFLTGDTGSTAGTAQAAMATAPPPAPDLSWWASIWQALTAVGADLWIGSLVLGVLMGAVGYVLTHRGVTAWRRRKDEEVDPETPDAAAA